MIKTILITIVGAILLVSCAITKHKTEPINSRDGQTVNLSMEDKNIEDIKWEIVEVFGKKVNSSSKTHYLIFNSKDKQLNAKANCNIIIRKYNIATQFKIKIDLGISTLMACPDNLEDEFNRALDLTDNYNVGEGTLSLNRGRMAPLARFKMVK